MKAKTAGELKAILENVDPDRVIILSRDPEGNGFMPLEDVEIDMTYEDGEVYLEKLTPEDIKQGYSEEDVYADGKKAVVLWP